DDPNPIDETYGKLPPVPSNGNNNGNADAEDESARNFLDPRMRAVDTYLTEAELSQCAHRNRPLRHDGRTVVTLCQGDISNLPMTTIYEHLPNLNEAGEPLTEASTAQTYARLEAAVERLAECGTKVTLDRAIAGAEGAINRTVAAEWYRAYRTRTGRA